MAKRTATQNYTYIDTNLDIIFNQIVYNVGGGSYNTATGNYTIGVAGLYLFIFDFYTFASSTFTLQLRKNNNSIKTSPIKFYIKRYYFQLCMLYKLFGW